MEHDKCREIYKGFKRGFYLPNEMFCLQLPPNEFCYAQDADSGGMSVIFEMVHITNCIIESFFLIKYIFL